MYVKYNVIVIEEEVLTIEVNVVSNFGADKIKQVLAALTREKPKSYL